MGFSFDMSYVASTTNDTVGLSENEISLPFTINQVRFMLLVHICWINILNRNV